MKHIVSVSIGSSTRNHKGTLELMGEEIVLERIGTDGDINKAVQIISELDGKVDAFGMGGIDLYLGGLDKQYIFREAKKIAYAAKKTPLLDGTNLKMVIEPMAIDYAINVEKLPIEGKKVLMVCAVDRIAMAQAFEDYGCEVACGDLIFALGISKEIKSVKTLRKIAKVLFPIISKLPFSWVYPSGTSQENHDSHSKYAKFYLDKDVIAGDFHFLNKYLPAKIEDKIVMTNTVTSKDIEDIGRRGAKALVTTTPQVQGRAFGTNVIEAMLVALIGKPVKEISLSEYREMITKLEIKPHIERY